MAKDRVTVQEAARRLGVKDDAVRKRIQRGSLEHDKDPDGRVYVYLDVTHDTAHDAYKDATQYGGGGGSSGEDRGELYEVMRDEIAHLRGQLEEEREARRRADTIIAQLSQTAAEQARTIRAIEPATADVPEGGEDHDTDAGPQRPSEQPQDDHHGDREEPRSWWRKLFS